MVLFRSSGKEASTMIHLGIDLDKYFSFITAVDERGRVLGMSRVSSNNRRERLRR
jgi:hypothetical protein